MQAKTKQPPLNTMCGNADSHGHIIRWFHCTELLMAHSDSREQHMK